MWWYLRKKYIFLENLPIYFKSPLLLSISIFTANWYSDKVFVSFPKIPLTFLKLHAVNIFLMICCFFFSFSLATHFNPKNRKTGILSWCPQHFYILGMFLWVLWIDEYSSILLWLPFSSETFYSSEFCKKKERKKQQQKNVQQFFFKNLIFKLFNYFYCILVSCASGSSSEKIVFCFKLTN